MKKSVYTLVIVLIVHCTLIIDNCQSQWVHSNGPFTGAIKSLLVSGSTIFAGVDGAGYYDAEGIAWYSENHWGYTGLFSSSDYGQNWNPVPGNSGLRYLNLNSLAAISSNIFAGTDSGVFRSTDNGMNWAETSSGITNKKIIALFAHGANLYVGTATGIFLSANNGSSWNTVNNGLTYQYVYGLTSIGANVYTGTNGGVFMTTNNGGNWTSIGLSNLYVFAIASIGNNLFAGTLGAGVYVSTNNGTNWTSINSGLLNYNVYSFGVNGTNLFAGTEGGIFFTSNNGLSWISPGLTDQKVNTICSIGGSMFSGTETGGVFKSANNGTNWAASGKGLYNVLIHTFAKYGNNLFCTNSKGVFLSTDNGLHWAVRNNGFDVNGRNDLDVTGLYNKNGVLYASVWGRYYRVTPFGGGIFKSTNNGLQWISTYQINDSLYYNHLHGINGFGNTIFLAMNNRGVHRSTNDGYTWSMLYPAPYNPLNFVSNGTYLFTANKIPDLDYPINMIRFNENSGSSIGFDLPTKTWHSLAVEGNTLFAGTDTGRIYKSTNLGDNWVSASNGIPNTADVTSIAISGQNIFAGTKNHGLYLSKDNGNTWAAKNDGLEFPVAISAIYVSGNDLLIGTTNQSVWRRSLSEIIGIQNIQYRNTSKVFTVAELSEPV